MDQGTNIEKQVSSSTRYFYMYEHNLEMEIIHLFINNCGSECKTYEMKIKDNKIFF